MRKCDEIGSMHSCLNRARSNELMFVLLARDACAPAAIRFWANARLKAGKNRPTDPQIVEAFECADAMDKQRSVEFVK